KELREVVLAGGRRPRGGEKAVVGQDAERRTIELSGARLARLPERASVGTLPVRKAVRSLDAPVVLRIVGRRVEGERRQPAAFLFVPGETPRRLEVAPQGSDEGREVEDVVRRVRDPLRRNRPLAPVRALVRLVQGYADARLQV